MTHQVAELLVECRGWLDALPDLEDVVNQATALALEACQLDQTFYSVSILACDDTRIAALNAEFRGQEKPTNVLSWPALELAAEAPGAQPKAPPNGTRDNPFPLGDVAIALQTCQREAISASKPLKNHVTHLILHGVLHVLGYDHETPADAELMEGIERKALSKIGIPDPYE